MKEFSTGASLEALPVDAATALIRTEGIPSTRQQAEEAKQVT